MHRHSFHTPILFLIFNRPDTTERVFQQIRALKPKRLFVSADGPRSHIPGEAELCTQTRSIIKQIDWDCEVKTRFSEKNQGCKIGVSSGIDWFFQNVVEGIILEDDCLPDITFFNFCEILLNYYRNDSRIMHICGTNFQDGKIRGTGSYYFSAINHVWGWATWKRAWDKYDVNIENYPELLEQKVISSMYSSPKMEKYWRKNFKLVHSKRKDTWDFQWQYAVSVHHGLAIIPNKNLVSNIGFDTNATHTIDDFHPCANRKLDSINTLNHPMFFVPDLRADYYTFRKYMSPKKLKKLQQLIYRWFN
jgi:hypothetical protein